MFSYDNIVFLYDSIVKLVLILKNAIIKTYKSYKETIYSLYLIIIFHDYRPIFAISTRK